MGHNRGSHRGEGMLGVGERTLEHTHTHARTHNQLAIGPVCLGLEPSELGVLIRVFSFSCARRPWTISPQFSSRHPGAANLLPRLLLFPVPDSCSGLETVS